MHILSAGLSRTGTMSLCRALNILGMNSIHWAPERLRDVIDGSNNKPDFRRYDDVDAVTDLPAAIFYREICDAYPECRLILTTRNIDDWYRSVRYHYEVRVPANMQTRSRLFREAHLTQMYAYGSPTVSEFLYKKKFTDHNRQVLNDYPNTLVLDISSGDGWEKLCSYLDVPVPDMTFPHSNATPVTGRPV